MIYMNGNRSFFSRCLQSSYMSTYFCISLEQKHQSPSSKQCLWKDPTLSERKYEITNSNTKRGIHLRKTNMRHKKWRLGRCSSFSKGCFSGSMLIFGKVYKLNLYTSFQPPAPWPSISYCCTWSKTRCSVTWRSLNNHHKKTHRLCIMNPYQPSFVT